MLISDATARALEAIAARERDVVRSIPAANDAEAPHDRLECSLPPDTYFVSRSDSGTLRYTRGQPLSLREGAVTDAGGNALLGYRRAGGTLETLRADAVDEALGLTHDAQLSADGTVAYARWSIDPRTGARDQQMIALGRLALARFPAGTRLSGSDQSSLTAPKNVAPHIGMPGDGSFAQLQPLSLIPGELDRNLQRLQEAYLALDALRAAGAAQSDTAKTAMDLLK